MTSFAVAEMLCRSSFVLIIDKLEVASSCPEGVFPLVSSVVLACPVLVEVILASLCTCSWPWDTRHVWANLVKHKHPWPGPLQFFVKLLERH
jgi:hypothetical protein